MRYPIVSAMLAILFLSSLFAATALGTDPSTGTLTGQLVDSQTGASVSGTVSFLMSDGTAVTATTGEKGVFTVSLGIGEYQYIAQAEGYEDSSGSLEVTAETTRLMIEMVPVQAAEEGVVFGYVVNHDGVGIPKATVTITQYRMEDNYPPGIASVLETGEKGGFEGRLPLGHFGAVVEAEGYDSGSAEFALTMEEPRAELKFVLSRSDLPSGNGSVLGRVITKDGRGIPGALVLITEITEVSSRMPATYKAQTGDEGRFEMKLPYGAYGVSVEARGYDPGKAQFKVNAENPRAEVKIVLTFVSEDRETGIVHILVQSKEGKGIPGAFVAITPVRVNSEMGPMQISTGDDGTYTGRLLYGSYSARAEARGFQAGEAEFILSSESPEAKVLITLLPSDDRTKMGMVHGFVFTGEGRGIPNAVVTIMPLDVRVDPEPMPVPMDANGMVDPSTGGTFPPDLQPITVTTDENGKFSLRLPFGAYMAMAEARGFMPGNAEFRLNPDVPETRLVIAMEPFQEGEERSGRTVRFELVDRNSDGNPEHLVLLVELNGAEPPEVHIEIVDENSDGVPESMVLDLNMEPRMVNMLLFLLQMYIGGKGIPYPEPGQTDPTGGWTGDDGDINISAVRERIKDLLEGYIEDGEAAEGTGSDRSNDDGNPQPGEGDGEGDPIAPKGSDGGASTKDLLTTIGVITILLGVLGIVAFMSLKRNGN
jgi:hypothetical protein